MKNITINGKEYEIRPIDFNAICALEDKGFSLQDAAKQSMKTIRALVALVIDCDIDKAGKEVEQHIANGGKFSDFAVLIENLTESDFFRNISRQQ
jgi:hypothetical protein